MEIKEFQGIKSGSNVIIIGSRCCGKTSLIKDLIRHNPDISVDTIISPDTNTYYDIIASHVYDNYSPEIIHILYTNQHKTLNNIFCVMDDVFITPDEKFNNLIWNGRHLKISTIISQQYYSVSDEIATNIDYVFIGKINMKSEKQKLYENYGGMFPTFEGFCMVLDSITSKPYTFMVINNASPSSKIEDQCFWYTTDVLIYFKEKIY